MEVRLVPSTVQGIVYDDANQDGVRETGEALVTAGTVELDDDQGGAVADVSINPDGSYAFNSIGAGTYTVQAWAADGVGSAQDNVRLGVSGDPGEVVTHDIGMIYSSPVVSVTKLSDAVEGGTDGEFEFARTGETTNPLTLNYTVGGTAIAGTSYTPLSGTVTFAAGSSTADVPVATIPDGVDHNSEDTVTLTINSNTNYTVASTNTANVIIIDTDTVPTALDNFVAADVNKAVTIPVLDSASDLDGNALTVSAVSRGSYGSVTLNSDGTVTYTPNTGFTGDDQFTYTVEDSFGNTATGTISVTVTAPSAPPIAVWTAQNTAVNIPAATAAVDPDGDTLTVSSVTQGSNGSAVINSDGTVTYTPNSGFTGNDQFQYTVEDPDGNTVTQTITVTVGPIAPIAVNDTVNTPQNTAVNVTVLNLAYQPSGGTLTTTAATQGSHGSVTINTDGTVTYTPSSGYSGTDQFQYTVTDANSVTATGTITVVVGTPAPTTADNITTALTGIQNDIANYTSGTAATIATAVAGLTPTLNNYLDDVSSFISANNANNLGADKAFGAYQQAMFPAYKEGLYADLTQDLAIEQLLWNIMVANKQLLDSIQAQRTAELKSPQPSGVLVRLYTQSYKTISQMNNDIIDLWGKVNKQTSKDFAAAFATWRAMVMGKAPNVQLLFAPPVPPKRDVSDILPK
jgi:hypothetical protein